MAIDTRDKRASALGRGLWWLTIPPRPSGELSDAADRRQVAGLYRGIATASCVPPANRLVHAFRERLIGSDCFSLFVSYQREDGQNKLDEDGNLIPYDLGPRVYPKRRIDVRQPMYPCCTVVKERSRQAIFLPYTHDWAFVRVSFYSQNDEQEAMEMYEVARALLHDQKTLLSTSELCVHGVFEVDSQDPDWMEETSAWMGWSLYKVRATVL